MMEFFKNAIEGLKNHVVTIFNSKKYNGLHFTTAHTGKMAGMYSLSTSSLCNKYCKKYAKDAKKVCSHCYANTLQKRYTTMQKTLEKNTEILTSYIIPAELLPIINALYFRFEAFGDIQNTTQVINYFNICRKNPLVSFALWTKNPFIIQQTIDQGYKKPENLNILLSSHFLNVKADASKFAFVDKVFTVYDKETIASENITINCGSKNCLACGLCYRKNDVTTVNEKLK